MELIIIEDFNRIKDATLDSIIQDNKLELDNEGDPIQLYKYIKENIVETERRTVRVDNRMKEHIKESFNDYLKKTSSKGRIRRTDIRRDECTQLQSNILQGQEEVFDENCSGKSTSRQSQLPGA